MKYLYPLLLLALLSSCHNKFVDIQGTVTGFSSGTMVIKDGSNQTKYTEDIENGKFHFHKIMDSAGFYKMRIIPISSHVSRLPGYDVYLEPGNYTISAVPESAHQYPDIKSSSPTQQELSDYYTIANRRSAASAKEIEKWVDRLNSGALSRDELMDATAEMTSALASRDSAMGYALQDYIAKNPQSHVAAHIIYGLNYDAAPDIYYPVYQKMSDEQKKTPEGVEEGNKFAVMGKLLPGNTAPAIFGNTLDGKPFNPKSLNKKLILVEFWRSDYQRCRVAHVNLVTGGKSPVKDKDLATVSVSFDTDEVTWKKAVETDGVTWTQVSDLKGDASPNMTNWMVTTVPTYYLLDANWTIVKRNLYLGDLPAIMSKYLATH